MIMYAFDRRVVQLGGPSYEYCNIDLKMNHSVYLCETVNAYVDVDIVLEYTQIASMSKESS
jgi:hypothetical protein